MDDDIFSTTLAYTKSPKTSRRTTFQYELETAVSARANRQKPNYTYSDDFDDDENGIDNNDDDDMLGKLLRIKKQKKDRFKAGNTKGKINDFKLSDDEEENVKPHKVSFLKTKRNSSPVHTEQLDSMRNESHHGSFHSSQSSSTPQSPWNSVTAEKIQHSNSPFSSQSDQPQPDSIVQTDQSESVMKMRNQTESSLVRKSLSESPLPLNSENSRWESSVPLPSEGSHWDSPVSLLSEKEHNQKMYFGEEGELPIPHPRERSVKPNLLTGCFAQDMSPRPMPRQKTGNMCESGQIQENTQPETPACSGVATSSMSIVVSNTSSLDKIQNSTHDSVQGQVEDSVISEKSKTNSTSTQKHMSEALTTSESEENREGTESTSFQENKVSQSNFDHTFTVRVQTSKSTYSSRKSKSSYTAESKYLGTLKILDQKETQQIPDAADSLRAAVYQEWLKKKEENIKIKMRAKKQEEKLNEEKRQEEKLAKIADAKASYDAWKEKTVDVIRKKVKEKQEAINEQQMEREKKQEKKETAIQVFEKWKQDHDKILKERMREKKQNEKKEKQKQVRDKDERKSDCTSAFIQWSAQKKNVIQERVREEHENNKINEMEEEYEKEEREKMALEMYDKWMRRKEFQQKRERKEKKIHAILLDEPPPPWSPPNKTIPFGK
ncbi:microtubule-associated protein 9 isoform X2 [Triplophysa dalaica]|uniref:microtubule-associated protein 9 isoform X2 n=1 Tax=Triplophysa dalaica TaxID=1582913 RepID=UPI0024DFC125|nr:microtubule-associated protein 9 isoform X2 [Triplophysa dalaica]